MNTEGNTPSATPATVTRLAHFQVGHIDNGSVGYGSESWPVIKGVVKCPLEVATGTGWMPASDEQAAAYDKALEDASKKSASKDKAEDKDKK